MIRIGCEKCRTVFVMPSGASVGEMSAWMRWHSSNPDLAVPDHHALTVHTASHAVGDHATIDVTHDDLRFAMQCSRDFDEGMRDAAAFVISCIDNVAADPPITPRERGAWALLTGVRVHVGRELSRAAQHVFARTVSPDAEKVREQADALDVGKPVDGDDTAPLDVDGGGGDGHG